MKIRLLVKVWAASMLAFTFAVILWACQKEKYSDDTIGVQIACSQEMENYVVAGYEMQAALEELQKALNTIDFSKLEITRDADGKQVTHLPIQSLAFEAKLRQFNDRKRALQRRYPQIISLDSETRSGIVATCVQKSETVGTKLLDLGINIYQPRTKRQDPEGLDEERLMDSLGRYTASPTNVEAMFFGHDNGLFDIHIDSSNTRYGATPPGIVTNGGKYYWRNGSYPNSPINTIGHTHFGNDSIPSHTDSIATRLPGVRYVIFQGGAFHDF